MVMANENNRSKEVSGDSYNSSCYDGLSYRAAL